MRAVIATLCIALSLAGCASSSSSTRSNEGPARVRCLNDSRGDTASGQRPLFFFLCAESP